MSMLLNSPNEEGRFPRDAGIAIGPILFVIAVLGVLASAIAAGSGSFSSSSNTEASRTRASALIEIGQNLKMGFDRVSNDGTNSYDTVTMSTAAADSDNTSNLFSPHGGGLSPPSTSMGLNATVAWSYVPVTVSSGGNPFGVGSSQVLFAFIPVSEAVCHMINSRVITGYTETTAVPASSIGANIVAATYQLNTGTHVWTRPTPLGTPGDANWPADFRGSMTGCVNDTSSTNFLFFQVLGVE